MSETMERAHRARRLRDDEVFQEFIENVRADAISQFERSGAADTAAREEAHAILRALSKLTGKLDAAIANGNRRTKKGQHRGSD